ncbi:DUF2628 domain-containing protein [Sporosarcina jiandibaonis]|uniref:DUF2628 domain-containing protein n=1 Tax=Sporosarcina jiandibaonis TaxID=2715535 RepID=UPI001552F266|nr:DUF2628 domain-containing protein [Sporosarcina jiandibaonis]
MENSLYCPGCGKISNESDQVCGNCGEELTNAESPELLNSSEELKQNQDQDQVSENDQDDKLLKAFVGERKQSYYFGKWQQDNRKPINWAALFATFFWLGYRKMYKVITTILLIFLAIDVLLLLTGANGDFINRYIGLGVAVALGIGGNGMYKNHAQKEIEKLKAEYSDVHLLEKVKKRGGTSWNGVWLALLLFIGYVIISMALEIVASLFSAG